MQKEQIDKIRNVREEITTETEEILKLSLQNCMQRHFKA